MSSSLLYGTRQLRLYHTTNGIHLLDSSDNRTIAVFSSREDAERVLECLKALDGVQDPSDCVNQSESDAAFRATIRNFEKGSENDDVPTGMF